MTDYTESQRIYRAEHAKQLLSDDLFAEMLAHVRFDALNELSDLDPDTQAGDIRRQQAIVHVTDEIREALMAVVIEAGTQDGGTSATTNSSDEE